MQTARERLGALACASPVSAGKARRYSVGLHCKVATTFRGTGAGSSSASASAAIFVRLVSRCSPKLLTCGSFSRKATKCISTSRSCSVGASAAAASKAGGSGQQGTLGSDGCLVGGVGCSGSNRCTGSCCAGSCSIGSASGDGSCSCIGCWPTAEGVTKEKPSKGEAASLESRLDHCTGEGLGPPNRDVGARLQPGRGTVLKAAFSRPPCGHTTSGRSWTRRGEAGAGCIRAEFGPCACEESRHERA